MLCVHRASTEAHLSSESCLAYWDSLHVVQAYHAGHFCVLLALQGYDAINSDFLHALQAYGISQSSPMYTLQAYDDRHPDWLSSRIEGP